MEFIYFDSSAALPALIAIEIPPGIFVCSWAVAARLVMAKNITGIIFTDFISIQFKYCRFFRSVKYKFNINLLMMDLHSNLYINLTAEDAKQEQSALVSG